MNALALRSTLAGLLLALAGGANAAQASLVGSATLPGDGSVQLTSTGGQAGASWRREQVDVTRSFEVRFAFSLTYDPEREFVQADGIAFVIQNAGAHALGDGGGGLGFQGLTSAASVVRTYTNNNLGITPDGNPADAKQFDGPNLGNCVDLQGAETVTYDAASHVLKMRAGLTCDGMPYHAHDSRPVDLQALLGTSLATIGMTGGTGDNYADQRITRFTFKYLP